MSGDDKMRDWSDVHVDVETTDPDKFLDSIRSTAAATDRGVTKPFGDWLDSPDAEQYAKDRTGDTAKKYRKIGGYMRWGNYGAAYDLYREIGSQRALDKAAEVYATWESQGFRRGLPSVTSKGNIQRGLPS